MRLERDKGGDLWFSEMSPLHVDTLMQIPEWLQSEDPRVRDRLLPRAYDDPEEEEQWRKYGASELEHLFASRSQIITKDLESLAQDGTVTFSLCIPVRHVTAWLSALNGARLALYELADLDEEDLERDPADVEDLDKELVLVRIHIMAYMQELLLEDGP